MRGDLGDRFSTAGLIWRDDLGFRISGTPGRLTGRFVEGFAGGLVLVGHANVRHVLRCGGSVCWAFSLGSAGAAVSCFGGAVSFFPHANVMHRRLPSSAWTLVSALIDVLSGSSWWSAIIGSSLIGLSITGTMVFRREIGKGGLAELLRVPGLVISLSSVSSAVDATLGLLEAENPRLICLDPERASSSSVCESPSLPLSCLVRRDSRRGSRGGCDLTKDESSGGPATFLIISSVWSSVSTIESSGIGPAIGSGDIVASVVL